MTDQQKVREAFEAWITSRSWYARLGCHLRQTSDGNYCHFKVNDRWIAWQAALAHASSASAEECSVDAADAITLMRFIFRHFGDVSMSHHLTDEVVAAVRRIEAIAGRRGDGHG